MVATGKKGQKDLRVWFSYILSTDSGFQDGNSTLLLDSTFNKAVVLYVTSTKIRYNTQRFSYSHRVWTMQSGEAARWVSEGCGCWAVRRVGAVQTCCTSGCWAAINGASRHGGTATFHTPSQRVMPSVAWHAYRG